jgi:CRP-like cAMP-binding protein
VDIFYRLRLFEMLSHFSNDQLDHLEQSTSRLEVAAGTNILQEGEDSHDIYLIDSGDIEIRRDTPYGSYTLAHLGSGQVFGETSYIDRQARSGNAVASCETVLFRFDEAALRMASEADPLFRLALHWTLWKSMSQKLRSTNKSLAEFFSKGSPGQPKKAPDPASASEVHIAIHDKRNLFREQKLSQLEINFLSTLSKEKKFAPGEHIFRTGDAGDEMFIVLEGRVMISMEIIGSGEEALAFLERGDYFGEMALIDHQPRSADAKADAEGAVVLSISQEVLEGILDIQKVSSVKLLQILCDLVTKRLREIDDKLVNWYIFNAHSGESLQAPP